MSKKELIKKIEWIIEGLEVGDNIFKVVQDIDKLIKEEKKPLEIMSTKIKYARKCDITGEGMNEGYCIQDGLMYIKYEKDMIKHLRDVEKEGNPEYDELVAEGRLTDEYLLNDYYESDYYYYTDWFDTIDEEDEWYTEDGRLIVNT